MCRVEVERVYSQRGEFKGTVGSATQDFDDQGVQNKKGGRTFLYVQRKAQSGRRARSPERKKYAAGENHEKKNMGNHTPERPTGSPAGRGEAGRADSIAAIRSDIRDDSL